MSRLDCRIMPGGGPGWFPEQIVVGKRRAGLLERTAARPLVIFMSLIFLSAGVPAGLLAACEHPGLWQSQPSMRAMRAFRAMTAFGGYHLSPRAGKMETRPPHWKAGPISLSGICLGNRSRRSSRSTRIRKKSSQSETRRNPNSSLARECRLIDQPCSCSLQASFSWDQPRLSRHLRTWGPIRFKPSFIDGGQRSALPASQLFPR